MNKIFDFALARKRLAYFAVAAALLLAHPCIAQMSAGKPGSWSGILVTSACNADEAFNESPECLKTVPGAEIALYDDTNREMYSLAPQSRVTGHLGDPVTVRGTLNEDTIQVSAIGPMDIGLEVGQKAPDFSVRDQSGNVQSLSTLRGPNGTVLLFFRSADW